MLFVRNWHTTFQQLLISSDEGYSSNTSCPLNEISNFLHKLDGAQCHSVFIARYTGLFGTANHISYFNVNARFVLYTCLKIERKLILTAL